MTVFDTISKGIRDVDKKGKLVRRKRRQKKKMKMAKRAGDTAEVKRLSDKKAMTSQKRKKAQKSINKGVQDLGKRAGKAGIAYLAAGGSPAGVAAATTAFVA
tara:strand:- start:276 stop:581 length:306 start_codon:yes stop_codon:yes gene_type:complete